jgi:hypothetical protein
MCLLRPVNEHSAWPDPISWDSSLYVFFWRGRGNLLSPFFLKEISVSTHLPSISTPSSSNLTTRLPLKKFKVCKRDVVYKILFWSNFWLCINLNFDVTKRRRVNKLKSGGEENTVPGTSHNFLTVYCIHILIFCAHLIFRETTEVAKGFFVAFLLALVEYLWVYQLLSDPVVAL